MKKQFLFLLISFQLVFAPAVSMAGEVDQKKADKAKKEGPVEQITAAVAATLGMTIPISCPKLISSPDTAVYIAGSLAYLGLEVASMVVLRKANKKSQGEVAESDDKNKQLEAIKANKKNFEEARKAAYLRIAGLSVFTATTYTAMALAITGAVLKEEGAAMAKSIYPITAAEGTAQEKATDGLYNDDSCKLKSNNSSSGAAGNTTSSTAQGGNSSSAGGSGRATPSSGSSAGGGGGSSAGAASKATEANKFMEFGKGMAGGLMCMALGFASSDSTWMQGACGLFGLVLGFTEKSFNKMIRIPRNRAIMFGTVAALDTAAVGITGDKIVKLNDYIKNLDTQIKDQETTIKLGPAVRLGPTAGSSGNGNLSASTTPAAFTWNLPDDKNAIPKEIRDIEVPTIQMPKGISSPTLTAAVSDIQNMARSIQKGQFSSANVSANNLINNAAKLRKLAQDLEKTYNEKLIASGQEPVNFTQEIEKNVKELQKDLNSADAGMPSLLASAASAGSADASNKDKKGNDFQVASDSKSNPLAPSAKAGPAIIFSEEGTDAGIADELAMAENMNTENDLKNFKVDNADIQKDSGPSIFDVLSVRYLKTAYPTLLKKLK